MALQVAHLCCPVGTKVTSKRLLSSVSPLVSLKVDTAIEILGAKWAHIIANSGHLWETGRGGDLLLVRERPPGVGRRQKGLQGRTPDLLEKEQVTVWLTCLLTVAYIKTKTPPHSVGKEATS